MSALLENGIPRARTRAPVARPATAPLARITRADAIHDRLYFAQVREDPRAELAALRPGPRDVVVAVSSGGCTVLSLLAAGAGRVMAIDLNATQNHLVELKAAATSLTGLEAIAFLGALPARTRPETYASLRPALTPAARAYWDARPRAIASGVLRSGVSERFIGTVVGALKLAVHSRARVERLLACRTLEEQRTLYEQEWNSWRWRALYALLCNRLAFRSTYPAQFFANVERPSFAGHFRQLAEHALTELPVSDNYFLHEMLTGRYPVGERDGVPPYLTAAGGSAVNRARQKLTLIDGSVTSHLRTQPDGSVDVYALSNICEWMSEAEVDALFREILRTAAPGARLVYRNFLGWTELPEWCDRIVPDHALSERLSRDDRSLLQRRVVACRITEAG